MSTPILTPNLISSPQQVEPQLQDNSNNSQLSKDEQLKNLLLYPQFHALSGDTQKQFLAERYDPRISTLNGPELSLWKQKQAERLGVELPKIAYQPIVSSKDAALEFARPFISDAVGAGAGLLAGPETLGAASGPVGIAAKSGVDALVQKLEDNPPTSVTSQALDLKPGGVASTLANTGEMLGTNYLAGKAISLASGGVKGVLNYLKSLKEGTGEFTAPLTQEAKDAIERNKKLLEDHALELEKVKAHNDELEAAHNSAKDEVDTKNKIIMQQYKDAVDNANKTRALQEATRAAQIRKANEYNTQLENNYQNELADYKEKLADWQKRAEAGTSSPAFLKSKPVEPIAPNAATYKIVPTELPPQNPISPAQGIKYPNEPKYKDIPEPPQLEDVPQVPNFRQALIDNIINGVKNGWKEHMLLKGAILGPAVIGAGMGHGNALLGIGAGYSGYKLSKALTKTLIENPKTGPIMQAVALGMPINDTARKVLTDALEGSGMVAMGDKGERAGTIKNGQFVPLQ